MSYNKHNLAVAKCAAKNSIKPDFGSVAFYGNRTVATDSFRLLEVSADGEAHEPKLLNAKDLARLVKLGKDEKVTLERLEEITGTKASDIKYPDVDVVINSHERNEDYVEINLNGRYLAEVALTISKLGKFEGVTLRVPTTPGRPVLMYNYADHKNTEPKQKARGLVMPFNR